jgi:prepilin-type N-terminal cleavage/methylation domain-containing protein
MFPRTYDHRRPRKAYTLVELLLVLAILVIAAAAVMPSVWGVRRNFAIKAAADDVRTELTKTHVLAMRTGRIQAFRYELGGAKYSVESWIGGDDALESPEGDSSSGFGSSTAVAPTPIERSLPEGAKFVEGDAATESRSQRVEDEMMYSGGAGATWSRPILFYPDGSCSDAYIIIGNDRQAGIRLDLRGISGAVKVGDIIDLKSVTQTRQEWQP